MSSVGINTKDVDVLAQGRTDEYRVIHFPSLKQSS